MGNSRVKAYDNVIVDSCGDTFIKAFGNAYVRSYEKVRCELNDNAIYRCEKDNIIYHAIMDLN